jgi:hypothetical protein
MITLIVISPGRYWLRIFARSFGAAKRISRDPSSALMQAFPAIRGSNPGGLETCTQVATRREREAAYGAPCDAPAQRRAGGAELAAR